MGSVLARAHPTLSAPRALALRAIPTAQLVPARLSTNAQAATRHFPYLPTAVAWRPAVKTSISTPLRPHASLVTAVARVARGQVQVIV